MSRKLEKVNCRLNFLNQAWLASVAKVLMQYWCLRQRTCLNPLPVVSQACFKDSWWCLMIPFPDGVILLFIHQISNEHHVYYYWGKGGIKYVRCNECYGEDMQEYWEGVTLLFSSSRQISEIISKLRSWTVHSKAQLSEAPHFSHCWDYFCLAFSHVWTGMTGGRISGTTGWVGRLCCRRRETGWIWLGLGVAGKMVVFAASWFLPGHRAGINLVPGQCWDFCGDLTWLPSWTCPLLFSHLAPTSLGAVSFMAFHTFIFCEDLS